MNSHETLHAEVTKLLEEMKPILGLHGGSIELVELTADNVAKIRFKGACVGCAAADLTLNYGVKEILLTKCALLEDVVSVNDEPVTHEAPKGAFQLHHHA